MQRLLIIRAGAFAGLLTLAAGCGSAEAPTASDATCPDESGTELTYESFGQAFMTDYCTRCHSSALSASARNGAPSDHNFDTLAGIHASDLHHIDAMAAAGPERVNQAMPPEGAKPSREERELLGIWLACGAP